MKDFSKLFSVAIIHLSTSSGAVSSVGRRRSSGFQFLHQLLVVLNNILSNEILID